MTLPTDTIGSNRPARKLKRGDHVRMPDGRWGLALADAEVGSSFFGKGDTRPSASVFTLVTSCGTEAAVWDPDEPVFSRSPEEEFAYVEALIVSLRVDAKEIAFTRAAGGAR
jgi:hypothetical protein